jgi:transcriptional regulator GlxA family with amidase domain
MEAQLKNLLESALAETKIELGRSTSEVATYMAATAARLATLIGLPGYEDAVIAARNNVALYAAIKATERADAAHERVVGIIQGALFLAAQQLVNFTPPPEGGL